MELMPSAEQIPVGTEVSGVVTKGECLYVCMFVCVHVECYYSPYSWYSCQVSFNRARGSRYVASFPTGREAHTFLPSYIGMLPLDTECPGCAEYCIIPEYCLGKSQSVWLVHAVPRLAVVDLETFPACYTAQKMNLYCLYGDFIKKPEPKGSLWIEHS